MHNILNYRTIIHTTTLLILGFSILNAVFVASANDTTVIIGSIVNGTENGERPIGLAVSVEVFDQDTLVVIREGFTDTEGNFALDRIPSKDGYMYIISSEYMGVPYSKTINYSMLGQNVDIKVYDLNENNDLLKIRGYTMVVNGVNQKDSLITSMEMVTLENIGDTTFLANVSTQGPMNLIRFSLPPNAIGLDVQSNLVGGSILQVDRGFAVSAPIPPGNHEIIFQYSYPYAGDNIFIERSFPFGTEIFRVLVLNGMVGASGEGLEVMDAITLGSDIYHRLEAADIHSGDSMAIELTNLPQPSVWHRLTNLMQGERFPPIAIAFIFSITLLLFLLFLVKNRRITRGYNISQNNDQFVLFKNEIADLDDFFQQGSIEEQDYISKRKELRTAFLGFDYKESRV